LGKWRKIRFTLDAILTDTAEIGIAGSGLTSLGDTRLANLSDFYHADILFIKDDTNSQDEYTVTWFKNGVRQTSGITVPTIQVVKRSDGTDLIGVTAMTQIGSTGSYKYDATGGLRQTAGEAYLVISVATLDGSSRTFSWIQGRDASA